MRFVIRKSRYRLLGISLGALCASTAIIIGPAATALQLRDRAATEEHDIDVVYLVCGARAQNRRLQALQKWLQKDIQNTPQIWIGNDTQNSLWSRTHQRNLTRAEWAKKFISEHFSAHDRLLVPGFFSNTDGEMMALARCLQQKPDIQSVALVTCGFHARRTIQRFDKHAPDNVDAKLILVRPHWENRAPWIVLAEWAKTLRDHMGLTHHPWLSRQPEP